ncbi:putative C6 transcription factor [Aspergillus steynii IBT 23096]|uniref:Putative C6 transcription factor n=1 Tax=Aspergillus steynii IBT 23096 TaxID=1392250 RepID=A0A2I2G6Q3_9EURO|nr:putative C6 transcription factor [Aspergillus steynii IBT 23096]PLB48555.1 putative C6 transcription factor [Aspergillus steynii IBT 23096]
MDDEHEFHPHARGTTSPKSPPRRRRPALSCTICRRRKLKCDRSLPCGQCVKSKTPDRCVYSGPQVPAHSESRPLGNTPDRVQMPASRASSVHGGLYVFDSKHQSSANRVTKPRGRPDELYELRHRVQMLEHALSRTGSVPTPDNSGLDGLGESPLRASFDTQYISENVKHLPSHASFRGKNGKSRFCGRCHWGVTLSYFKDVGAVLKGRRDKFKSKDSDYMRLKKLRGEVCSREQQDHQRAYREKAFSMEDMIPHRRVADELLSLYLSTYETTCRILHVPTFLKQYEAYWAGTERVDQVFLAKLLALMAASSCFFGPTTRLNENDTLQSSASAWIISVQSWIASSFVSSTINLDMLQIQCLLMIARQADATDGDLVWISSGSVLRSAMAMGLHRSPSHFGRMTPFWAEMRRRLWTTILEFDLQSSLDGGMPPSIDLDEYDCEPPSNYDDTDMTEEMTEDAVPKDLGVVTRSSFQVLLSRSLGLRMRIAKLVNSLKFEMSYDEALRLGDQLMMHMNEALTLYPDGGSTVLSPSGTRPFARSLLIFLMRRFLLVLHRPFALSISLSPKFSFSRKICLESSLEMLSQLDPPPVSLPEAQVCPHTGQLGGGMFRDEFFHAALSVSVELCWQMEELSPAHAPSGQSSSLSSLNELVRSQQGVLLRAVESTLDHFGNRINTRGKGCKAFFFLSMVLGSVKARMNGEDPQLKAEQVAMRAIRDCEQLIRGASWADVRARQEGSAGVPTLTPGLDSTSSEIPFDSSSIDPAGLTDLSPYDFATMFDGIDYGLPDLWDNNFLTSFFG